MSYYAGQKVRIAVQFTDVDSVPFAPSSAVLTVKAPDGTTTTPTVNAGSGTGAYSGDVLLNQAGEWYYRWTGTGALIAVAEGPIVVLPSRVL